MQTTTGARGFAGRDSSVTRRDDYNHGRFHPRLLAEDLKLAARPGVVEAGQKAPLFELADTEGRRWRLDELRGEPVVLITGSATCPATHGSVPALKKVHTEFADQSCWFYLYVREAHPGEKLPAHGTYVQKRAQAEFFRQMDHIPWPVLVDDLDGTVARQYTQLPNAVFVIDAAGTIVFRGTVAHAPTLRRALHELLRHGGRGRIEDDSDRMPHMLGATAFGWEAIERGGRMAVHDMWKGAPPLAANLWLGNRMNPLIGPFARRDRKIPAALKVAAAVAAAALIIRRRRARE